MPSVSRLDVRLRGMHVLVTGGGSGLGRAMAVGFAGAGAVVTINGRTARRLEETVDEIRGAGGRAEGIVCDVRDHADVQQCVKEAEDRQGELHALVNNAAANFLARTESLSHNAFDVVVRTNLYGSFFCTQAVARRWMSRRQGGVVLSIATTYADTGSALVVPSAMSKAGIVVMTKSLAVEWGRLGIRLNAIAPGPFPTEGAWSRLVPDSRVEQSMKQRVPLNRFGRSQELVDLATFMISGESSYMNGSVVTLDGGEVLASGGQFNDLLELPAEELDRLLEHMRGASRNS